MQKLGEVKLVYWNSENQLADIFTKPFHVGCLETIRDKLGVCAAQNLGGEC